MVRTFLVLCLTLAAADLNSCLAGLKNVIEGFATLSPETVYEEMASYSGKSINDLGDYFSCCKLKDAEYALFLAAVSYSSAAIGFCGPQNCTVADYYSILNDLETEDEGVARFAKDVNALKTTKSSVRADVELEVEIIFPQTYIHDNFNSADMSAGSVVMLVFCVLIVLVATVGSVLDYLSQRQPLEASESYELMSSGEINGSLNMQPASRRSTVVEVLKCFSVYTNLPKLFASRSSEKVGEKSDTLDILNGVRVMSMGWVILGHVYIFRLTLGVMKNLDDLEDQFKQAKTSIIYGGFWAVDSFFWLSGLLMAFLLMQTLAAKGNLSPGGWAYLYAHRFYRIVPAYMFVIFLSWAFLKYSGNGPMWIFGDGFNSMCHDWWWTNLIFLNNFIPHGDGNSCLPQSWYLANDMQFFLISPPIIFLYHKVSKVLGWLLVVALCCACVITSMVISSEHNYNVVLFARQDTSFMTDYYMKPYCRVAPYAIGIATGWVLFAYRQQQKTGVITDRFADLIIKSITKWWQLRYCWYGLGLAVINFFMFIQYNAYKDVDNQWQTWSKADNLTFLGFNRLCWGLGLTLVLLPVLLGYNAPARWILAHGVWTPLARLTFCTYLIHLTLVYSIYLSMNTAYWLNDLNISVDLVFVTVVSYAAAVPLSLFIESPFMAFEKLAKGGKPSHK